MYRKVIIFTVLNFAAEFGAALVRTLNGGAASALTGIAICLGLLTSYIGMAAISERSTDDRLLMVSFGVYLAGGPLGQGLAAATGGSILNLEPYGTGIIAGHAAGIIIAAAAFAMALITALSEAKKAREAERVAESLREALAGCSRGACASCGFASESCRENLQGCGAASAEAEPREGLVQRGSMKYAVLILIIAVLLHVCADAFRPEVPVSADWQGMLLYVASALGLALGGIAAGFMGAARTAVFSLLLSMPLIAMSGTGMWQALAGIVLFKMSLPAIFAALCGTKSKNNMTLFAYVAIAMLIGELAGMFITIPDRASAAVLGGLLLLAAVCVSLTVTNNGSLIVYKIPGSDEEDNEDN